MFIKDDRKTIWIRLPYLGNIGDNMKKNCLRKVKKCLKENVHFITCYETKKTAMFCSTKDSIPIHQKANIVYKVTCPGCNEDYVGKTDCNLVTRLNEHGFREDQPMYQYLLKCEHFAHVIDLHRLPDNDASATEINNKQHFVNTIISNFCVLDTCCNWSQLLFLEALYIKDLASKINDGFKGTCGLVLF